MMIARFLFIRIPPLNDAANLNPLAGGERSPGFFDDVAGAAGRIGLLLLGHGWRKAEQQPGGGCSAKLRGVQARTSVRSDPGCTCHRSFPPFEALKLLVESGQNTFA